MQRLVRHCHWSRRCHWSFADLIRCADVNGFDGEASTYGNFYSVGYCEFCVGGCVRRSGVGGMWFLNKFATVIALFGWEPRQKRVHWMPHYVLYISSSPTAGLQSKARST